MAAVDSLFTEVARKLRDAAHKDRAIDAAQVRIIGLESLRVAAGDNWPKIKDNIRVKTHHYIQSLLAAEDMIIPCGDGFLVVFASPDLNACSEMAALIQDALEAYYLGDDRLRTLKADVQKTEITAQVLSVLAGPPPEEPAPVTAAVSHETRFQPVWSAKRELIAGAVTAPFAIMDGSAKLGYDSGMSAERGDGAATRLNLDLELLRKAQSAIVERHAQGRPFIGGAWVHFLTLRNPRTRTVYLEALANVPADLRKYFFLKVVEIPDGVPLPTLSEMIGSCRALAPCVGVQFDYRSNPREGVADIGAWAVGLNLTSLGAQPGRATINALGELVERWRRLAPSNRCRFFLDGVTNAALLRRLCDAGIDFAGSEDLWPSKNTVPVTLSAPIPDRKSA